MEKPQAKNKIAVRFKNWFTVFCVLEFTYSVTPSEKRDYSPQCEMLYWTDTRYHLEFEDIPIFRKLTVWLDKNSG